MGLLNDEKLVEMSNYITKKKKKKRSHWERFPIFSELCWLH